MEEFPDDLRSQLSEAVPPLREIAAEMLEVYQNLIAVGMDSKVASAMVAHMMGDALAELKYPEDDFYYLEIEDDTDDGDEL